MGSGKLGDPALAGAAIGIVGAGGSFTGVTLGASRPACFSASGEWFTGGTPNAPPGTMADAVDKAIGGS